MKEGFPDYQHTAEAPHSLSPKERRVLQMFSIANLLITIDHLRKSQSIQKERSARSAEELLIGESSEFPESVESLVDNRSTT